MSLHYILNRSKESRCSGNESKDKSAYVVAKKLYRPKIKQEKILASDNYINNTQNKCKAAWNVLRAEVYSN